MLTAAAILMSLDTKAVGGHHAPSGPAGAESMLFAESFREGAMLGAGVQPPVPGGDPLLAAGGQGNVVAAELTAQDAALAGTKPMVGKAGLIKDATVATKTLPQAVVGKTAILSDGKVLSSIEALQAKTKIAGNASAVAQGKTAESQPAAGDAKIVAQGAQPDATDATDATETVEDAEKDVTATATPVASDVEAKVVMGEQDKTVAPVSPHDAASTIAEAKGHEGSAKAIKAARPEEKQDKSEVVPQNAGSAQAAAATVTVPSVSPAVNAQQQSAASVVQNDDAAAPVLSAGTKQNIGATGEAKRKGAHEAVAAKKPEENVASVSAPDNDTAPHKVETDDKKVTADVTSGDGAKIQDAGAAAFTAHLVHAETSVVSAGSAVMHGAGVQAGNPAVHDGTAMPGNMRGTDAARTSEAAPQMLQATPNMLEVGVASGTHGWLKIRAEMSGGGVVNASLSPASSSAQDMLHRELPSLTAYLQSEHVAVHTVVVQPVAAAGAMSREFGGRMNGDGGGQSLQNGAGGGEGRQERAGNPLNRMSASVAYRGLAESGDELLSPTVYMAGRSWLSVRA